MAGYSGTPLPRKLGIKAGHRLAVLHSPDGFEETLSQAADFPPEVVLERSLKGRKRFNVVVLFIGSRAELLRQFDGVVDRLEPDGGLWVAWPKKASGVKTDLTEDVVRQIALDAGLVDNKVCAIDETWSGLRLVIRVQNRRQ